MTEFMRGRRLRTDERLRRMVQETHMNCSELIYPMFVMDGQNWIEKIPSMYGQNRYTVDRMGEKLEQLLDAGVNKIMLFGIPEHKDETGSQAYDDNGIVQRAFREAKKHYPEMYLIGDVCMCEYTSHGHCGIIHDHDVDNDATLSYLAKIALSQVEAGADMVAPSDMMDGRIAAIRQCLDEHGHVNTPIMSYAVKFASAYYGPFRDAADSAPQFGNRRTYQMDFHNRREAMKEALADIDEGADIIMVKPAMIYGDLIREIKDRTNVPMAAYSVSGEYAMIKGAASLGLIDEDAIICETAIGAKRAGADIYLTYFAQELAGFIKDGRL